MNRTLHTFVGALILFIASTLSAQSPQALPFTQNWTDIGQITTNDDWSGVLGIIGDRGDGLATGTGADPQLVLAPGTVIDVNANQTNPNTFSTGGVTEFHITDPVVALSGSGTAKAPNIVISINTMCHSAINVSYNIRDIDGSADNAIQQVALQYRIGNTGNFTNIPAGYIADATSGPSLATLVTPVSVVLPMACENQAEVQLRIITTDAAGSDEWVGIDDINITGTSTAPTAAQISGDGEICTEGNLSNIPVVVNITGGVSPFTVVYNDGTNDVTVNNYVSGDPLNGGIFGSTTYTLVSVTDANGCEVPPANLSGSANIVDVCASCVLSEAGLSNVHCENNAESPASDDDYIWFTLNPIGENLSSGYSVTVSSGSVLLNGNAPATNVPYGSDQFFRLQSGSAGSGNVTLTVTDQSQGSSCSVIVMLTDPGSCSQGQTEYFISDPCICNNDATAAGNDGTFGEQITVLGAPGQVITGTCTGCIGFTGFTEENPGEYLSNVFSHVDGIGYSMDLIADGQTPIGTISNYCAYPNVAIDAQGPFTNCLGQADLPLTANVTGDGGTGTYAWSGDGVTGSNFNPSGLPAGNATINLDYTGIFVNNISNSNTNPAYPGCIQPATADFVINDPAVVDAGAGGSTCPNAAFNLNASGTGLWSGGSGTFSDPMSPTATYTPAFSEANSTVILTWTVQGACDPNFDTIHINVLDFVNVNAGMNMDVCFGPVMLTGSSNAPGMWTGGAGSFDDASNPMTTYTPAMSEQGATILLTYTATNSCGSTNASIQVTFSENEAEFFYSPDTLCTNDDVLLPSHTTGMDGAYTYTAISGGNLTLNPQTGEINPVTSDPGQYKITNTITPAMGTGPSMIITGILDGPLTGGIPKAIELYVINDIANLSLYGLENASNGAASAGVPDFTFPAGSALAGTFIYVSSESPGFLQWFGFAPTYVNGVANNNGDDAVLLYENGAPIDVYGVVGVDGTGQVWETLDGWGHRNSGSCPTTIFNNSQWSYSGINAWDDENVSTGTNATSTPPYPNGMFSAGMCQGAASCTSVFMDTVVILPKPFADAGVGQIVCGINPVNINGTGIGGTWSGGAGTFGNPNLLQTTYTPASSELGKSVVIYLTVTNPTCGSSIDSTVLTFLEPAGDAEFSYQSSVFCPNGENPVVSHTTGMDGTYTVTQGNPADVDLNANTGEINLANTELGTYEITNTFNGCGNLMITAIVDGDLPGGQPKALEFYALNDIPDLSLYKIGIAFNGSPNVTQMWNFPAGSLSKGDYIYVANNLVDFQNYFGFSANYLSNQLLTNGNDVVQLYCSNVVIDVYGNLGENGTGTPWEYMDGWAYRKNNTSLHGASFEISDWTYSGPNALDGATTNASANNPVPIGTYNTTYMGVCPSSVYSVTITIGDDVPPTVACPQNITIGLDAGECSQFVYFPSPTATDNCPGTITIVQTSGPQSGDLLTSADSPYTVVYEITDANGNPPVICSFTITIIANQNPTQTLACNDQINVSLTADCDAVISADMVLEGGPYRCYETYDVHISGLPSNIVTYTGNYTVTVTDPVTGNSCWGTMVVEDKLAPVIACTDPMCNLEMLQGSWDLTDPVFSPDPSCWSFDGGAPQGNSRYDVIEFDISVGGNYTFTMTDSPLYDGIAAIYGGSFDPNNTCDNLIAGDDDITGIFESEPQFTVALTPGHYILVSTTWATGQLGIYNWTFTGPAALQVPCEYTCFELPYLLDGTIKVPAPSVQDCSPYTVDSRSVVSGVDCGDQTITRTYTVTDAGGYTATCEQNINVRNIGIDDIILPPSLVLLSCGSGTLPSDIVAYYDNPLTKDNALTPYVENNEGYAYAYPHYVLNGHVQKIDESVCHIIAVYQDIEIDACGPGCGGNKKVIRKWTLLDWCTAEVRYYTQIIKASDNEAPTYIVKDITVSTAPWYCAADFDVPMPWELHDNCDASPSWSISGPAGVIITGNSITGYKVAGAPKGVHTFTYSAVDCCGNVRTQEMRVTVVDKTKPVAVAIQNLVVSLTVGGPNGGGNAKIFTTNIDGGSYDACTDVHLEIRREDGSPACNNLGLVVNPTTGEKYNNNVTYDNTKHEHDNDKDTDSGQYVKFCCEDLTDVDASGVPFGMVKVWLRVWDDGDMDGLYGTAGDNYNETWAYVRVEDKSAPALVCPPDVTVTCDMDLNISTTRTSTDGVDMTMTGGPASAYGTCGNIGVDYQDLPQLNSCNIGTITRRFFVAGRNDIFCVQRITVTQLPNAQPWSVTPPSSAIVNAPCDFNEGDIKDSEKPVATGGPCDVIGESITIDTFYFEDGACKKWRVAYEYINWCTGETKGPFFKFYKYEDPTKPVLTDCTDKMIAVDGNCEAVVTLTNTATDEGACQGGWLKWQILVDLWGDGTYDWEFSSFVSGGTNPADNNNNGIPDIFTAATSSGQAKSITIPGVIAGSMSNHKVLWKVTDGCGNVTSCETGLMVVDKKAPTPYCVSLSSAVMQNGQVELWARDFDKGSFDNCTAKENLLFTFNEMHPVLTKLNIEHYFKGAGLNATEAEYNQGNAQKWVPSYKSSSKIFDCDEVPISTVKMSVWDEKLNTDYCLVTLTLADNQGACDPGSRLQGSITTTTGTLIKEVELTVEADRPEYPRKMMVSGNYQMNVAKDDTYKISADKRDDYSNGVSTLDLVLIQRHILGLKKFDDPYKMIAADVTNDEKVTAADLVEIRKLILGLTSKYSNASSWEFMPKEETMTMAAPYDYNAKSIVQTELDQTYTKDFFGVKMGDVNGSVVINLQGNTAENRTTNKLTLNAIDKSVAAGDVVEMNVTASNYKEVFGYQYTAMMNGLTLTNVKSGALAIDESNYGMVSENTMTMSYAAKEATTIADGEVLFTLVFRANSNGNLSNMINLGSSVTKAESYTGTDLEVGGLELSFRTESSAAVDGYAMYQNEPNPFKGETLVRYNMAEAGAVKFTLYDVTGKVILVKNETAVKGSNTVKFSKTDINASGVVFYQMESGDFKEMKKMILVD